MAAVTICSDFGASKNIVCHCFHSFPHLFAMKWWDQMPWSSFSECWVLSQFFPLSSFTFIKRLFSSSSLSTIRVASSAYLRLLIILPAILIPVCASSSPEFLMMYSAHKFNKQGDNIHLLAVYFFLSHRKKLNCKEITCKVTFLSDLVLVTPIK